MESVLINVSGMSCEHCVKAVTDGIGALKGVNRVEVNLSAQTVTVDFNAAECDIAAIENEIEALGYEVSSL